MSNLKLIVSFLLAGMAWTLQAQNQQGYVKTLGRPNQKGVALSGVTIRVKGGHNAVLSNAKGLFSMSMTGKKEGDAYAIQQVQKQGYQLNDANMIGRRYAFSSKVPLTIVMVSSQQFQADKQRIENNAYKTAEKNYKTKIALLEKQQKANQITIEKYRKEIKELQDCFEKYQSLIDDLADHYARTDYDELDAKEQEISLCIENGDLDKAEQLLQALDIEKRLAGIEQRIKTGQQLKEEADKEMALIMKQQEKDAEYLYQLYTIALGRFDNEKARFYIETRAQLDSTNIDWQRQTIEFLCEYASDYNAALHYAERAMAVCIDRDGGKSLSVAGCLNLKGAIRYYLGRYDESLTFYEQAAELFSKLSEGPTKEAIECYLGIGNAYLAKSELAKRAGQVEEDFHFCELMGENYLKSLELCMKMEDLDHRTRGTCFYCIALFYEKENILMAYLPDYKNEADEAYNEAMRWFGMTLLECEQDKIVNAGLIASCYMMMSNLYYMKMEYTNAIGLLDGALEELTNIYGEQHPLVATCLFTIATNYSDMGLRTMSLDYYQQCYDIRQHILGESHPDTQNAKKQIDWTKAVLKINIPENYFPETIVLNYLKNRNAKKALDDLEIARQILEKEDKEKLLLPQIDSFKETIKFLESQSKK